MKRAFISRIALVAGLVLLPASSLAVVAPTQLAPGQGLQISPPLVSVAADPGQTVILAIKIRNISSGALVIHGTVDDFGAKGEAGEPQILLGETASTRYSLKYWIATVPSVTLKSQEQQTLNVPVNVPKNAEPGGHYGVVRFTGTPPNLEGTGVALSASIGTLVLFTVNGDITEHLSAVDITASQKGATHSFFEQGPLTITERIKNDGNVHERPKGNVVISNLFGRQTASLAVDSTGGNILPDSIRKFSQDIGKKNLFGRYTVKGSLVYGNGKTLVLPVTSFWVIPYKLIIAVLLIVTVLFFLLRFGLRRYNAYIIKLARK